MLAWWTDFVNTWAPSPTNTVVLALCCFGTGLLCYVRRGEDDVKGVEVKRSVVAGFAAEQWWVWPEGRKHEGLVIVVIPGMPGVAQIYEDFMRALVAEVGCPAVCTAWSGHHRHAMGNVGLEAQAEFFTQILLEIRKLSWVTRIVLVGQSLGTWLSARALANNDEAWSPVVQVHLACPVLEHVADIPRGKHLLQILERCQGLGLLTLVQAFALLTPLAINSRIMHFIWWCRGKTGLSAHDRQIFRVTIEHIRIGVLRKAVSVGAEALSVMTEPGQWLEALRRRTGAVTLHFAIGDLWTPASVQDRLWREDRLPSAKRMFHRMPHGILTQKDAAERFAVCLGKNIVSDLRDSVAS